MENKEIPTAKDILKKHWATVTNLDFDKIVENHLDYVINAMQEHTQQHLKAFAEEIKNLPFQDKKYITDSIDQITNQYINKINGSSESKVS